MICINSLLQRQIARLIIVRPAHSPPPNLLQMPQKNTGIPKPQLPMTIVLMVFLRHAILFLLITGSFPSDSDPFYNELSGFHMQSELMSTKTLFFKIKSFDYSKPYAQVHYVQNIHLTMTYKEPTIYLVSIFTQCAALVGMAIQQCNSYTILPSISGQPHAHPVTTLEK